MESIREVKEALAARSQTRSLDELQSRGRRRVKVIRAEHIAEMIDQAVQRAIAESGRLSREEADRLVERSREEFAAVHAERAQEAAALEAAHQQLESATRRREVLEQQVASLEEDIAQLEAELTAARSGGAPAASAAGGMPPELMMKMMEELAVLKARMGAEGPGAAPAAQAQPAGGADALTAALEKLSSSMGERLEQLGRKMGVSSAVAADAVNLEALFSDLPDQKVESNLDTMEVKQRQSGGIAANLARLKKLKGGD